VGRDSIVDITARYGPDGPGIESRWEGEIFPFRPDPILGPPSLLHNGYQILTGVKRPGLGVDQPPPSTAEVKERAELWAIVACSKLKLPFPLTRIQIEIAAHQRVADNTTL
jgi:hypothetical protein